MYNITFNQFCEQKCDGLYDSNFPDNEQCNGYIKLKKMINDNIDPVSIEEIKRWETNPTQEEMNSIPDVKYLQFLHPVLRPYIIDLWLTIKNLEQ